MDLGLSDREAKFVLEYMLCLNMSEAARKTGLSKKAPGMAGKKMMARPHVKLAIEKLQEKDRKDFEIQRYEILYNLWACATRDGRKFVNDRGELISPQEIKDLPDELGLAIDSVKQKVVRRWTEEDGTETEILETELKLVSKAAALDMAMKHKGLFAQGDFGPVMVCDFSSLYQDNRGIIEANPVNKRLEAERVKLLPDPE